MEPIRLQRSINSTPEQVFSAVADFEKAPQIIDTITAVEFLTEQRQGRGTRFKETRRVGGKEVTEELEVSEWQPHERLVVKASFQDIDVTSIFEIRAAENSTTLQLTLNMKPNGFMARMMLKAGESILVKTLENDLDAIKSYLESAKG